MRATRRRFALAAAMALVVLAACDSPMSQSDGSGGPSLPVPSLGFVEPSESEEPVASAQPPTGEGVTGTWDGTWDIDPPYETVAGGFTMELVQSGSSFSGPLEVTNTDCTNGSVEGSLSGSNITFGWVFQQQPVQFEGTLGGSSMSGTWSAFACSDSSIFLTGTWDATKRP